MGLLAVACGVWFPDRESNLSLLHWKCRVSATGLPASPLEALLKTLYFEIVVDSHATVRNNRAPHMLITSCKTVEDIVTRKLTWVRLIRGVEMSDFTRWHAPMRLCVVLYNFITRGSSRGHPRRWDLSITRSAGCPLWPQPTSPSCSPCPSQPLLCSPFSVIRHFDNAV